MKLEKSFYYRTKSTFQSWHPPMFLLWDNYVSKHHELALTGQVTLGWDHQPGYSSVKTALHSRNWVYFLTTLTVNEWFLLSVKSLTAKVRNGIFCKALFFLSFLKLLCRVVESLIFWITQPQLSKYWCCSLFDLYINSSWNEGPRPRAYI